MDLNRLYSDHQRLLMQADRAPSEDLRRAHTTAASHLAERIGRVQRALGATAAPAWETLAAPAASRLASPGSELRGVRVVVSEHEDTAPARPGIMRFRKSRAPRLEPEQARRQGEITRLAYLLLGRDKAIAFLNTDNAGLCGRPLDLATASDEGRNSVEAELGRLAYRGAEAVG